ncbi:phage tail tube protein [Pseudomonas monteilii]|uniref:phage tail tube protein n=1 Tax=Pseudomonas monteilii TaxID=76759 RepID=UPI001CBBF615|nr:phage tail tube protein [Pseudomonas monteilii]MBZ3666644.1 Ig domain-containing protein [Pseudomonas monteilii]MBZ3671969.1 Ig domain-containing protein [Pseudomonas monteilii]
MSSGAQVTSYMITELSPGVTPATGAWDTLRLTGNTLSPTVNTQVSDEITDSRISQGSVVSSADIQGDLVGELSYGTFDKLLEAAFYGTWTGDVLTVGSTRRTFTVAKNFNDVNVYTLFRGMHVSVFALDIPSDGKITATFTMAGLDYADGDTNTVADINPPTTTPFMSNLNIGSISVDGQSLEGVACVSALTVNLDNSLQAQRCIGSGKLGPGAQIATEAAITGTITLAWSNRAWQIWKNTFTRKTIEVEFPITDSLGNRYDLSFPALEVDGDLPNGGKRDLIEVTLNWTVSKLAPSITRVPFVPVSSVSVTPSTASIAVAATRQLAASALPSGAAQNVTWSSSAPSIATVNSSGLVTGVAAGSAVITATSVSDPTKTATSAITVTA